MSGTSGWTPDGVPDAGRKSTYDAEARRDRYYAGPLLPGREWTFTRHVSKVGLRLMVDRESADITFAELAAASGTVTSRTLRRHFPTVAAAAYATTWWLTGAADAVRRVLAPRERVGPCWPADLDDPEVAAAGAIGPNEDLFAWPPAEFFTSRGIADPLAPGAVSPHPITLRDFLVDLWTFDVMCGRRSGYALLAPHPGRPARRKS